MRKSASKSLRYRRVPEEYDLDLDVLYDAINTASPPGTSALQGVPTRFWWLADPSNVNATDPRLAPSISEISGQLRRLVNAVKPELKVALLELSLFHPDDPRGTRFFSFLLGQPASLTCYLKLIEQNLSAKESRGPLIPNGFLYDSPFYTKFYGERKNPSTEVDGSAGVVLVEYASGNSPEAKFEELCEMIDRTFDSVVNEILGTCVSGPLGSRPINGNFAALIPLLRPAASHDASTALLRDRVRGGGLFLYGERNPESATEQGVVAGRQEYRSEATSFLLKARHALVRGIMGVSYSRVDQIRRENIAAQSTNLANAHEIRKFIIAISSSSPRSMLSLIRAYFTFLFPIRSDSTTRQIRSLPFVRCGDLDETTTSLRIIVLAAFDVAAVLRATYSLLGNPPSEQVFDDFMETSLNNYRDALDLSGFEDYKFRRSLTKEEMWGFCGALVCAFRNTLEHADFEHGKKIAVTWSRERAAIVVQNSRLPDEISGAQAPRESDPGANSLVAFSYYLGRYKKDHVPITRVSDQPNSYFMVDPDDISRFLTVIPMPED